MISVQEAVATHLRKRTFKAIERKKNPHSIQTSPSFRFPLAIAADDSADDADTEGDSRLDEAEDEDAGEEAAGLDDTEAIRSASAAAPSATAISR